MSYYEILVLTAHFTLCAALIILVLLQQGKGADAGAALAGGGASLFGASGAKSTLTKFTTYVAISFMLTSILLVRYYHLFKEAPSVVSSTLEGSALQKQAETTTAAGNAAIVEEKTEEAAPVKAVEATKAQAPVETKSEEAKAPEAVK